MREYTVTEESDEELVQSFSQGINVIEEEDPEQESESI
jgi:hypothetical protein